MPLALMTFNRRGFQNDPLCVLARICNLFAISEGETASRNAG